MAKVTGQSCHCLADAGLPMWECHWSDNPQAEDAMPCLCLCHPEALSCEHDVLLSTTCSKCEVSR